MISELQNDAWTRLTRQLGRLPHAMLLHGAPGVGKLALAERFAQLLLCERREQGASPCGHCEGCRWFLAGNHPDARIVEPAAVALALARPTTQEEGEEDFSAEKKKPSLEIRIDDVRALAGFVNLKSHRGSLRIAIIHPAEDMKIGRASCRERV